MHSSFRKLRAAFNELTIDQIITDLKEIVTHHGSIVMPAFTYCYKIKYAFVDIFNKNRSPVKVGALAELFRLSEGVLRTSSPTHSFSLWGEITKEISEDNSPESPLGAGSVLQWLAIRNDSYVLMLGTDFSSLSFGHYIETAAPVPWSGFSPWGYMRVEPAGISDKGEQNLIEVPGCSKSFVNFENYLLEKRIISRKTHNGLHYYYIPINLLLEHGLSYFKNNYKELLCAEGSCLPCDERRNRYREIL